MSQDKTERHVEQNHSREHADMSAVGLGHVSLAEMQSLSQGNKNTGKDPMKDFPSANDLLGHGSDRGVISTNPTPPAQDGSTLKGGSAPTDGSTTDSSKSKNFHISTNFDPNLQSTVSDGKR